MASIGLKVNHDQFGSSLAGALSKAMLTDPSDAIAAERLKSQLLTDELERKRLVEATSLLTQQTIDQSMKNKRANYAYGRSLDAAGILAGAGVDIVNGEVVQKDPATAVATENPVVVGEANDAPMPVPMLPNFYPPAADAAAPGGRGAPESLVPMAPQQEPNFNYHVTQYPLLSDQPVPVDLPPMPPQLQGVPPGLTDRPPMPPALEGVPPDLNLPPMQPPVAGVPKGLTYYGMTDRPQREQPGMLDSLLQSLGMGGEAEPPVVDDVAPLEQQYAEPATSDNFITLSDVGNALGLGGGGEAVAAPAPAAPAAAPQAQAALPADYFNQPVSDLDMPVPVETEGPPIAAGANYRDQPVSDLAGAVPPTPAPDMSGVAGVLPENAPEAITVPGRELPPEAPAPDTATTAAAPVPPPQAPSVVPPTTPTTPVAPAEEIVAAVTGADGGASDTATTVQTTRGPMSRKDLQVLMEYALTNAENPEAGVQAAQRLLGTLGAQYNPGFGTDEKVTENLASLRQGGAAPGRDSVLGTDAAIRKDIAVNAAKPEIREVDKRLYEITKDANGKSVATLIPGQPAADEPNPYGDTETGKQLNYVDKLLLKGLKNATPEERRHFETMTHQLWKSTVHVTADGTVVVEEGDPPPGFPRPGEAFKSGTLTAPAVAGTETAPAATPASATPDTGAAAPAAPAATPAATEPASAYPPEKAKKDAAGRYIRKDGYKSYGGYLVEGQNPPEPETMTVAGKTTHRAKPGENTNLPSDTADKQASYTSQALDPAAYFLKLKKGDVKITPFQSIVQNMAAGTKVEAVINRMNLDADDREYYRNVIEIVKDMSHKDSGADVTRSDLETYKSLYELPINPEEKDIALLKRSIRSTLRKSRVGFNGKILSETLRAWDAEAGRLGIDLDEEDDVAPISNEGDATAAVPEKAPPGFEVVDGKVVRKR